MWTVKVNRENLLDKVVANRATHSEKVGRALERYREAVIADLSERIELLKAGKSLDVFVRLPVPEDHTADYDTVIGMLNMSTEELVTLGTAEYANFCQDIWSWSRQFATSNAAYGVE